MKYPEKELYEAPSVSVIGLGQEGVICSSPPGNSLDDYDFGDLDENSFFFLGL